MFIAILLATIIGVGFKGGYLYAIAAEASNSTQTDTVAVATSTVDSGSQELVYSLLEGADLNGIEKYMNLYTSYTGKDASDLSVDEIVNYIKLYGNLTGVDLVSKLGLQNVMDNIDTIKNVKDLPTIITNLLAQNNSTSTEVVAEPVAVTTITDKTTDTTNSNNSTEDQTETKQTQDQTSGTSSNEDVINPQINTQGPSSIEQPSSTQSTEPASTKPESNVHTSTTDSNKPKVHLKKTILDFSVKLLIGKVIFT